MKQNTHHWIDQSEINGYLIDIRKHPALSRDDERLIIDEIRNGNEKSKIKLINANLRYVVSMAKKYQNNGLSLNDLISEGNYGLVKAAERYDYFQDDVRFLSYAVWWIKQSIIQAINESGRTIRLPVNVINEISKYKHEVKEEFDLTPVPKAVIHAPSMSYLDAHFDDEGNSMHDLIEDVNSTRPDMDFNQDTENLLGKLKNILSVLNETEKYVVIKYFGLDGDSITLQDISEDLELTKERVRQIKEKAIKKLRFNSKELFELL